MSGGFVIIYDTRYFMAWLKRLFCLFCLSPVETVKCLYLGNKTLSKG